MSNVIAYSYIRFSTPEQIKGDSLRRQLDESERYCKDHNLTLDESLNLRDLGLSAFRGKNIIEGRLGAFLKAIENGNVSPGSILLVESLDRLSRAEVSKALRLFLSILENGIKIITLTDKKEYSPENINDIANILYSIIIMSRSHEESAIKSKRLTATWENKRNNIEEKKLTSIVPGWLSLDKSSNTFIIDTYKVKIVEQIFQLSVEGFGVNKIAGMLNDDHIPPFGRSKTGWHFSTIKKIITNRSVLGEFQPHKMIDGKRVPVGSAINDYFPKLINEELFYKANQALQSRRNKGGRYSNTVSNLFTHIAKCGYCGGAVVYLNKGDYSENAKQLACDCQRRKASDCPNIPWTYTHFEKLVLSFLKEIDTSTLIEDKTNIGNTLTDLLNKIQFTENELKQNTIQAEKLLDLYLAGGSGTAIVKNKLDHFENKKIELEKNLVIIRQHYNETKKTMDSIENDNANLNALIEKVQTDKSFNFRLKLREEIKNIVQRIEVYFGGLVLNNGQMFSVNENIDSIVKNPIKRQALKKYAQRFSHPNKNTRFVKIILAGGTERIVRLDDATGQVKFVIENNQIDTELSDPKYSFLTKFFPFFENHQKTE